MDSVTSFSTVLLKQKVMCDADSVTSPFLLKRKVKCDFIFLGPLETDSDVWRRYCDSLLPLEMEKRCVTRIVCLHSSRSPGNWKWCVTSFSLSTWNGKSNTDSVTFPFLLKRKMTCDFILPGPLEAESDETRIVYHTFASEFMAPCVSPWDDLRCWLGVTKNFSFSLSPSPHPHSLSLWM